MSSSNVADFVSSIEVLYDDDQPANTVGEINGSSADINKGQGGSYVWLRVHRANSPAATVNNIWVEICGSDDGVSKDLAKGAGGDYRFLKWSNNDADRTKITDVALWRSGDKQSDPPSGWNGMTTDINNGRGGDYLYLVWKTKRFL
ncbi:hypothetical protein BKA56DRAFT_646023 [Ilyonectria sp. MPI-CAGE-AT-0026]|nr:hypothetical protein BKA56DRAFT_646023 [Ilyonectria sp. MPI-CAGE-AT-0026]